MNTRRNALKFMVGTLMAICSIGLGQLYADATVAIGDSRYIGSIVPGTPSGDADQISYINQLISMNAGQVVVIGSNTFTTGGAGTSGACAGCPNAVGTGSVKQDNNNTTINVGSGFTYLYVKYGGDAHVWNIAGITGIITMPAQNGGGQGLSHSTVYNPGTTTVPEPSSLLLLGSGLVGVGLMARRRFKG